MSDRLHVEWLQDLLHQKGLDVAIHRSPRGEILVEHFHGKGSETWVATTPLVDLIQIGIDLDLDLISTSRCLTPPNSRSFPIGLQRPLGQLSLDQVGETIVGAVTFRNSAPPVGRQDAGVGPLGQVGGHHGGDVPTGRLPAGRIRAGGSV